MAFDDIPYPKRGDNLFEIKECNEHLAYVDAADAMAYLSACKILLEKCFENDSPDFKNEDELKKWLKKEKPEADILVYPIVFLFRHYVELQLKQIICLGLKMKRKKVSEKHKILLGKHDLLKLWKEAKNYVSSECEDRQDLKTIEENIKKFQNIDKFATAFRYPMDKKGNPSFNNVIKIDLKNFYKVLLGLETFFDGTIEGMIETMQTREENEFY